MAFERLRYAIEQGGLTLPPEAPVALVGVGDVPDRALFAPEHCDVLETRQPFAQRIETSGWNVRQSLGGPYAAVLVTVPRARDLAQQRIAEGLAALAPDGLLIVEGAKTDGIDAMLKALRPRLSRAGQVSKAHGKLAWYSASGDDCKDWLPSPQTVEGGFVTAPGVFSADGPDPASIALLQALPDKLGAHVADLGGGWGFLSASVLRKAGLQSLHLVEDDHVALSCAEYNLHDARMRFHWADATTWKPPVMLDSVVMNPPFHTGRKADPGLGQAFVTAAARILKPSGHLWMVANRHLPYEATLAAHFRTIDQIDVPGGFKIFHAFERPRVRR